MENLKGKRLLLLGGSLWKDVIKDFAKKHEITLIATGNNQNAGIFDIADECYNVDSTDEKLMKQLIITQNIDGVYMGGSETVISSACGYLSELNMPCYCTKTQWEQLQNKEKFKLLCMKHGLPVAKQYNVSLDQILSESGNIEFPVITKPSDGSGSNGFSVCNDYKELKDGYDRASECSQTKSVIVEKFVKNDGVVVFYTFSNGEMYFSGIEDKYPVKYMEQGSYVAGMHVFESTRKDVFRKKYENKIRNMFKDLEIQEGSVWMEVFCDGDDYYFNEAGYRYSGSVSIYPVEYFYNINQVAADIYYALTGKSRLEELGSMLGNAVPKKKYYSIYSIHLKPGKIQKVDGIKDILEIDNIVAVPITMMVNCVVKSTGTVAQVFGFVHFVFDSVDECKDTIEKIHENLKILDSNGQDMVVRLLDTSSINIKIN